ncbi:TRAP transporter small permease [Lysinibacillus telephonicus]|uniref:TRAP transporter small permease n=1 Tax=Lysinibacillus telephonicus TaxID=1714840 RepID=A0A431UUF8_9BACI|nr:TRAP transporter small permease [Lysinibacillus telephonicus]RTQ94128.1 TRAP transporter small permease [Lysinibacillus telephonicus]
MVVLRWLDKHIEEVILVILSILTVVIVFFQIASRNLLNFSLIWAEELARYAFIWMIYIGVAYGVKRKRHISVEVLNMILGKKGNKVLDIVANILFLVFAVIVTYLSFLVLGKVNRVSSALSLPMEFVYAAPLVGMLLASIRLIQQIVSQVRNFNKEEEVTEEKVVPKV